MRFNSGLSNKYIGIKEKNGNTEENIPSDLDDLIERLDNEISKYGLDDKYKVTIMEDVYSPSNKIKIDKKKLDSIVRTGMNVNEELEEVKNNHLDSLQNKK